MYTDRHRRKLWFTSVLLDVWCSITKIKHCCNQWVAASVWNVAGLYVSICVERRLINVRTGWISTRKSAVFDAVGLVGVCTQSLLAVCDVSLVIAFKVAHLAFAFKSKNMSRYAV